MMHAIVVMATCFATSAGALSPLVPCLYQDESNMTVADLRQLPGTGFVVEHYSNTSSIDIDLGYVLPAPSPELEDFSGLRMTNCATGEMLVTRTSDTSHDLVAKLETAPGMAKRIAAETPIRTATMRQAMRHLYGNAMLLVEDEETCGCNAVFPELRPKGMTPFEQRKTN